jgi:hypothetical protein
MNRSLLPVIGTVLLCAQSFCALAADASTATTAAQTRAQIEAKRDQLSGVATVAKPATQSTSTLLDAPVNTDDAPAQVQQP